MEVKIKVTDVTDYERDDVEFAGTSSHIGDAETYSLLADEIEEKEENGKWPGLPFTMTLEVDDPDDDISEWDEYDLESWLADEHMDEIVEMYCNEHCECDLIKPLEVEFEVVTIKK